jgi:hypothetical protein
MQIDERRSQGKADTANESCQNFNQVHAVVFSPLLVKRT